MRCHKNAAEPNKVMCLECADKERERNRKKRDRNPNKTRSHDLEKYYRLKEQGICVYCKHEKAVPGKTKCAKCLHKIRSRAQAKKNDLDRSEWVSYEICYLCGKNPVMPGKGVCESCYQVRLKSIQKCNENRKKTLMISGNNKII